MSKNLIAPRDMTVETISKEDADDLIAFVGGNIQSVNTLATQVTKAQAAVEEARKKVDVAIKSAEDARSLAGSRESVGWFGSRRRAINNAQEDIENIANAQVEMAETQIAMADAQKSLAEAQATFFEFQKQLAKITATMIQFSTANIATSRFIVRELEMRLSGASKGELTELARKELENVVYQIKAQQDIMSKQDQLAETVLEIAQADEVRDRAIQAQDAKDAEHDMRLASQEQSSREQRRILTHQMQKDEEHDRVLAEIIATDEAQGEQIAEGERKDREQDQLLSEIVEMDEEQGEQIAQNRDANARQDQTIAELVQVNQWQSEKLEEQRIEIEKLLVRVSSLELDVAAKGNKGLLISTTAVAAATLIISIIQFFV